MGPLFDIVLSKFKIIYTTLFKIKVTPSKIILQLYYRYHNGKHKNNKIELTKQKQVQQMKKLSVKENNTL